MFGKWDSCNHQANREYIHPKPEKIDKRMATANADYLIQERNTYIQGTVWDESCL